MRVLRVLLVVAAIYPAGGPRSASGQGDTTAVGAPASRLALLPIVFSTPDTRLALGVLPQYIFTTAPETRPSNLRAEVYYTFNRQFNFLFEPAVWMPGDRWQLAASFRFRKWPTSFYGVGPDSRAADEETFTEHLLLGRAEVLRRIGRRFYAGGGYLIRYGRIRDVSPAGGPLQTGSVPGSGSSRVGGIGLVVTYDTREHVYLPASGSLHRIQVDRFAPAFGGDRSISRLTVDLRRYVTVAGPVTAAFRATATVTSAKIPFRLMPSIGEVVRGYAETRYLDRQRWAVGAELRAIPVWWRLGLAVFGGVGKVAGRIDELGGGTLHYAAGIGLRFLMYPRERITVRQDFAFGRGSSGSYLELNEAF